MENVWSFGKTGRSHPAGERVRLIPRTGASRPGSAPFGKKESLSLRSEAKAPFARLLCDGRWRGSHGIGRFATEVLKRLPVARTIEGGGGLFLSPLDPFLIASRIMRERPLAYFTPGFNPPFPSRVPLVLTLHDLIHLKVPGEGGRVARLYYEHIVKPALRSACRVLTVSRVSKEAILEWAKIPEERVEIVGNGLSPGFSPHGAVYRPGFPYFLYVGNRKPHKNLPLLFEAVSRARLPDEFRLLLSGAPDPETEREIARQGIGRKVVFAGPVPEADLPSLYRGAAALLFPSTVEGFRFPVLEAMACGLGVLASDIPAVDEVAKGTVRTLPLEDPEAWAREMERTVCGDSPETEERKRRALDRACHYSRKRVGVRGFPTSHEAMGSSSA